MTWIGVVVGVVLVVAAIGGGMALVGSRLPQGHVGSRERTFAAPPEAVWTAITDVEAFPSWRSDVKRIERQPDRDGKPAWIGHTRSGRLPVVVERMDTARLLVVRIADPDLPFGGTWTFQLAPAPGGTRLTITENGEIYNPIFRFLARFVFGYDGTIASYLAALEKRFRG